MLASTVLLPTVDIRAFLDNPNSDAARSDCIKIADSLKTYSAVAIIDPRVTESENTDFINTLETYFALPDDVKRVDCRPELHYQVGATPQGAEIPRCGRDDKCIEMVEKMDPQDRPSDFNKPDNKWRFFWRMGDRPPTTAFPQLNAEPVVPVSIPNWSQNMNHWGTRMLNAVSSVSEMTALGLGLDRNAFVSRAQYGPHLLAPTGSDLIKHGQLGTILAGFHTDLNFLTIHGKSRFPGLHIWTPQGKKLLVKIPEGSLLVQAGKQLEWFTGGVITAGFHEVVVVPETMDAIDRQRATGRPLWRVSSTLFYHIASDQILEPLPQFNVDEEDVRSKYPTMPAGQQVQIELGFIKLATDSQN